MIGMREQIARAIHEIDANLGFIAKRWDDLTPYGQQNYFLRVDAALLCLLKPTDAMCEIGGFAANTLGPSEGRAVFVSMIQAAKDGE